MLGYGAAADPAGDLAGAIEQHAPCAETGRDWRCSHTSAAPSADPQGRARRSSTLREAGALVLSERSGGWRGRAASRLLVPVRERRDERESPRCSSRGPDVVNVGIRDFAESLEAQDVPVVQVDWTPPPSSTTDLRDLLERLG